ncbi:hypothetical protein LCGC14_2383920 [marine sediment metagenome]|uniref:Uncharacterized protein n=1 Tax=marine sediment metagenome TaxID=412755 RepID=A0A0F9C050_9ZZZZ
MEEIVKGQTETLEDVEVVLVWGRWSCDLGYIHWAYVAKYVANQIVNTNVPGSEKIGARLFDPPKREEVTKPKNSNYGKEPSPWPQKVCEEWIKLNKCILIDIVKLQPLKILPV